MNLAINQSYGRTPAHTVYLFTHPIYPQLLYPNPRDFFSPPFFFSHCTHVLYVCMYHSFVPFVPLTDAVVIIRCAGGMFVFILALWTFFLVFLLVVKQLIYYI